MTSVIWAGSITEIIEIGPTSLVRRRSWELSTARRLCRTAGAMSARWPRGTLPAGLGSERGRVLAEKTFKEDGPASTPRKTPHRKYKAQQRKRINGEFAPELK